MTSLSPRDHLEELTLGHGASLEALIDRQALTEFAQSFYDLFRVPLRILGAEGRLLADASCPEPLFTYLDSLRGARRRLADEISRIKALDPELGGDVAFASVTGTVYRVATIGYDGRKIGRMVFGPFLPPSVKAPPASLLELDQELDVEQVAALLERVPRAREETVGQIADHLRRTLDLILFSGHKALLTSQMHLASVRESYHELEARSLRLQEAYDRLKELDRLKSNFLATVSHELRTPLTSIIGYSEMLAEGIAGPLAPEQSEFVGTIREKGEQLLELIRSLLDLSKLESGTMRLTRRPVEVGGIIAQVHSTLLPAARKKGVRLESAVASGEHWVWGDAERLRQVVLNLAENAIKFTPTDGRVTLAVEPRREDAADEDDDARVIFAGARPMIEIRVMDTGIGIPAPERGRVFDAFYQVDSTSTREQGGTGLGLSIVKRLVEGHEGTVRVEGNEPEGSVFIVSLPAHREPLG